MAVDIPTSAIAMTVRVQTAPVVAALTITQRYKDEMSLLVLLEGLGLGFKERFRMLHDGFLSMRDLVDHYGNDIGAFQKHLIQNNKTWSSHTQVIMRAYFNPVMVTKLMGALFYFRTSVKMIHTIPDINSLTADMATEHGNYFTQSIADDDDDESSNIKIPDLTGAANWIKFRDNFIMMLSVTTGVRKIPIDYLIDDTVRPVLKSNVVLREADIVDVTADDALRTKTIHFGPGYKQDNTTLWNKLQIALVGKPGYNHISRYVNAKNGRSAWMALRSFYEAEDFKQRNREQAFDKLNNTFYKGESARFTFERYINIHKTAHKDLMDAGYNLGAGLDDETKITMFRNCIREGANLETAITTARGNPRLTTFDTYVSFMTAEVDHRKLRLGQLKTTVKRVAGVQKQSYGNTNNNKYNHKKKDNKGNQKVLSEMVGGKKIEGRFYNKAEFGQMTPDQRRAVIRLKRQSQTDGTGGNSNGNRSVSAVSQDNIRDDMITLGDAIIAGVSKASKDNSSRSNEADDTSTLGGTGTTGDAGSIGNLFSNRRTKRKRE